VNEKWGRQSRSPKNCCSRLQANRRKSKSSVLAEKKLRLVRYGMGFTRKSSIRRRTDCERRVRNLGWGSPKWSCRKITVSGEDVNASGGKSYLFASKKCLWLQKTRKRGASVPSGLKCTASGEKPIAPASEKFGSGARGIAFGAEIL
jgi:hypothetical protein